MFKNCKENTVAGCSQGGESGLREVSTCLFLEGVGFLTQQQEAITGL